MRILMISDTYFPRVSGVASSIRSFRMGLTRLGHEVDLLIPAYGPGEAPDTGILQAPARRVFFYPEERLMTPLGLMGLRRRLGQRRYDLIHIQTPFVAHSYGTHLAHRLEIPAVLSYHTYFEAYMGHYYPWFPAPLRRSLIRRISRRQCHAVAGVIVPSRAMAEILWSYGVNTPLQVIPTGIDAAPFASGDGAAFRANLGIGPEKRVLLYAGRIAPEKNIPLLLEVIERLRPVLPEVLLLLAGDGPARAALEAQSARRGLADVVRFLGYLDRESTLRDAYQAAEIFVFPSQTETQGMVLLEALAAGLPVVAIPALGAADLLASRQGSRSARPDPGDFSEQCLRLLRDQELRERLAREARELARRWSQEAMSQRLIHFYATLTGDLPISHLRVQQPSA
jgi:glycosyltransferase involved in cell wall biosynthesis